MCKWAIVSMTLFVPLAGALFDSTLIFLAKYRLEYLWVEQDFLLRVCPLAFESLRATVLDLYCTITAKNLLDVGTYLG
jgi:hypothetical protein